MVVIFLASVGIGLIASFFAFVLTGNVVLESAAGFIASFWVCRLMIKERKRGI